MAEVRAYIGLGSNLADPAAQVRAALASLGRLPDSALVSHSALYHNPPMGPAVQPYYVNAVAALDTRLQPLALLDALQDIEARQGRVRGGERWGPRIIDLDLLLYGGACIDHPRLQVPHAGLAERAFVLVPLQELAPDLDIPGLGPVAALAAACPPVPLRRLTA